MKHSDYLKKKKTRETRKKIISVISAIVVFITTYALVLPAITLDVSKASQEPGIAYEQMQFKATAAAASVTAADSTVEEAQVEEPAAEEPEEEPAEVIEEEPAETPEEEASAVSAEEEEEEEAVEEAPAEPEQEEAPTEEPAETAEPQEEKSEADQNAAESSSESAPAEAETADTDKAADQASVDQSGTDAADKADASVAATTAETAAEFEIPELDALDFDDILTGKTNFYYYHVENAEEAEEISSDSIDDWRKVGSDTVLAPEDFVRVYLAYEIPAGALNETNAVARYTLPAGLELSDKQIEAINKYENGIAASKSGSEQDKYLGAEAIEGSRTPDEKADDEYIAATVKVKKTDNGRQELVFTFIPYTVEKNQISYDERGEVKSKGKEVKGFFTFDLTTSQIDFEETNTETVDKEDGTTEEIQYSEAKVVFADKDNNRIDRTLTLAGPVEKEEAPAAEQKTLTSQGADYTVTVSYTDDAQIPDNAELTVREIEKDTDEYASYLEQAKGAVDNTKSVNEARFFDITILADGEKVEPQAPVNVQITFAGIEQTNTDDTQLLHYKDDEKIEVMDQAEFSKSEEQTVDTVQFETDGFSVYGIVGTETISAPFTASDGNTYEVTVNFGKDAGIPANAKLEVSEVGENNSRYDEYVEQAAEAINARSIDLQYVKLLDISIVDENGNKVDLNAPVDVQIKLLDKDQAEESTQVVHFEGTNETPVVVESSVSGDAVSFSTDGFSVYAVVDEGTDDEARMTVNFYNGDTLVASMIVKNGDKSDEERFNQILYDPGIGDSDSPAGVYFKGWTKNKNYSVDDANNALTIEDIRNEIKTTTITEGDVLNLYAANVRVYNITYLNEKDVTIGADTRYTLPTVATVDYTVSQPYTPDETSKFEGWNVQEGGSNIADYTEGKVYENGTDVTISGDVIFSVNAPKGQWLVFHENKGTYVAPQFIKTGETTSEPSTEMQRIGYRFDGWYTKDGTDNDWGEKFVFGGTISDRTHVYAKWTANETADYTILIWKQNTAGNGYDFAKSLTLNGAVGENIDVVSARGNGDTRYARINGTDYSGKMSDVDFTGFHLSTSQGKNYATEAGTDNNQGYDTNVKIKPEGGSVLNVYYDRNEITLTFLYRQNNRWNTQITMTGLYGQRLADKGYTWPTNRWWYDDYQETWSGYSGAGTRQTFMDAFLPPTGLDTTYYGFAGNGNNTVHWLKQNADDAGYTEANTATMSNGTFYITDKYNGFRAVSYSTNNRDWTQLGEKDANGRYASVTVPTNLYIRFDRLKYSILYMDGVYVDGNNNPISDAVNRGQLKVVTDITYESDVSSYNAGGANYYDPTTDKAVEGYVFEGWYIDDACTQPFTFTNMPEGITVYAKWRQVQYRVFLHPNAGTDTSLDWGSSDQAMNFRVSYGAKVSTPTGTRDEYEFVGWFTDPGYTNLFDGDAYVLNETTVTTPYDKTVDMTDPMDKWGNGATTNADINRAWITKKLDLYGRWRATLKGAEGIGILYDANGGTDEPHDTRKYLDQALAPALEASTAPDGQRFLYWVVQRWDGSAYVDTDDIVYPGDTFTVLKSNAREQAIEGTDPEVDEVYKTFTVQLRAEYGLKENETKTHITWYANNGTGAYVDSTNASGSKDLQINEAVGIKPSTTFTNGGRKFLGWARLEEDIDEETGEVIPKANSLGLGRDDLWLIWDEDNNNFILNDGSNRVVSKVAADEVTPYHDLYAVWAYRVTVKKVVDSPFDSDKAETNTFEFSASKNDGISESTTFTLAHNSSKEYVFDEIAYGGMFSVSETLKQEYETTLEGTYTDLEGKKQTLTGLTNGGNIEIKGDTEITVTNKRKTGTLTITKATNPETVDGAGPFKVSIANEEGKYLTDLTNMTFEDGTDANKWHDLTVGTALTIENIPVGTYTILEDTSEGAVSVSGYRYDGTDYKVGTGDAATTNAIATINVDETTPVYITNKYTKLVDVSVTKTLVDDYAKGNESFSFTASLKEGNDDITSKLGTLGEGETEYKFTLEPGEQKTVTQTFTEIPVGAVLNIAETTDSNYKTEVSVNGDESTETSSAEFEIADGTNSIVFTNTRKVYVVDFEKTAEDGTELTNAKFTLGLSNGSVYEVNHDWDLTLGTGHLSLPIGNYELTEKDAPDGYVIMTKTIHFQIDEDGNLTVEDVYFQDGTTKIATKESPITDGSLGTITVKNQAGKALPHTGGSGTLPYTLGGIALIMASALMYGFRMRRRERRLN